MYVYIYMCIYIYMYVYIYNIDKSDVFTKMRNRQYALRLIVGTPINQPASVNNGMLCDFFCHWSWNPCKPALGTPISPYLYRLSINEHGLKPFTSSLYCESLRHYHVVPSAIIFFVLSNKSTYFVYKKMVSTAPILKPCAFCGICNLSSQVSTNILMIYNDNDIIIYNPHSEG